MTASDHLNRDQFMPVSEVGKLKSAEPGMTMDELHASPARHDRRQQNWAKMKGFESAEHYQDTLRQHIANHGMRHPIEVKDGAVSNGEHRYFAAKELGWDRVPVSTKPVHGALDGAWWER